MSRRWLATTRGTPSVSKPRYELAFTDATTGERLVLCAATSPDEATIEFHFQLTRLREQSVVGELVVLRQDSDETTILRQPIGRQMAPTRWTAVPA
jgi:hypothetical protein